MGTSTSGQSDGRAKNAATPERPGLVSDAGVKRTGRRSRAAAGPDGPDAGAVGATFKRSSPTDK